MENDLSGLFTLGVIFVVILGLFAIRIVRPNEKGLVERLGKYIKTIGPGLNLVVPFIDKVKKVDMRERLIDVPPQQVITKDNAMVTVDAIIYFQVIDPVKVVYNISNFELAALRLAQTNLRNIIGDLELDETLTSREKINSQLRTVLDEATDKWGVKVTRVEIQKIEPPRDLTSAMSKQMKAEREKRAMILEAEGEKQSKMLRAEGEKQAMIFEAEGKKQSEILKAEGEKQALILRAEGEAEYIRQVFSAIHQGNPTKELLTLKYFETLKSIAEGNATKIFLPFEASGLLSSVASLSELWKESQESKKPEKS